MGENVSVENVSTDVAVNHTDVFKNVLELKLRECTISVCLASISKHENLPTFERLQLADELTSGFQEIIEQKLKQYKEEIKAEDLLFPEYAVESDPDNYEIEHFDLSIYNHLLAQIEPLSSLVDIDVFEEDERFASNLRFYVIIAQPSNHDDPVYFFRTYTPKKLLSRSGFLAAWLNGGSYDRVKVPLLLFDEEIDCMCGSDVMFIFNKTNFENIFRFFEGIHVTARETLDKIKLCIPIKNFDAFARMCEKDVRKLRKLKNIAAKPYLQDVTIHDIKTAIVYHKLSITVVEVEGQEYLTYDEKDKWLLLKLLDDNYLGSVTTHKNYEVTGKREIKG